MVKIILTILKQNAGFIAPTFRSGKNETLKLIWALTQMVLIAAKAVLVCFYFTHDLKVVAIVNIKNL